jgi:hypothetical protein
MTRMAGMSSMRAGLLVMILIGLVASAAQAQMCGGGPMTAQAGPAEPAPRSAVDDGARDDGPRDVSHVHDASHGLNAGRIDGSHGDDGPAR